jgi:hypothetical protein
MDFRTIATIALSNRDFPSFEAKLAEAVRWIEYARLQQADLVVLPELLNFYRGDGPDHPDPLPFRDTALSDWTCVLAYFSETAKRLELAVVLPLLISEAGGLANVFFLISKEGCTVGRFQKLHPAPGEIREGVVPGRPLLMDWDGVSVSGAICFDTHYLSTFSEQVRLGARLFIIPSLWNGGPWLEGLAARFATPMALAYPAWSRIIDLDGTTLAAGGYRQESLGFGAGAPVFTAVLNFDREVFHLSEQSHKIIEIQKAYGPSVRVRTLHEQAAFCIESLSSDVSVPEIIAHHGLVRYTDYLDQSEVSSRIGA